MPSIEEMAQAFLVDSTEDWVGLWEVAAVARRGDPAASESEIRRLALRVVRRMYELGLRGGENDETAKWQAWPDEGADGLVRRVEAEWVNHLRTYGKVPDIGTSVMYFISPKP
jgi:hypothetical protein